MDEVRAKSSIFQRTTAITTLIAFALMITSCVSVTAPGGDSESGGKDEKHSHDFGVASEPLIDITSFNGPIEIIAGDDGEVSVDTNLRMPGVISYSAELDGNTVRVRAEKQGTIFSIGRSPRVEIRVTVPSRSSIKVRTSNGAITVNGVTGDGELDTSNGHVIVSDVHGSFELSTVNGGLTMNDVSGEFEAHTTNGRIEFSGSLERESENEFTSTNGSIEISFTSDPNLELDARTSNGTVESDLPVLATTTTRTHLVGVYGDGSGSLRLSTSNGSIHLR